MVGIAAVVNLRGIILPDRFAGAGILILALSWSAGVLAADPAEVAGSVLSWPVAYLFVALGGLATVGGTWLGLGGVAWAMARLLGARPGFMKILWAISAASPPLWIAAPAVAILAVRREDDAMQMFLAATAAAGILAFVLLGVSSLRAAADFSLSRGWACASLVALFCTSVSFLAR